MDLLEELPANLVNRILDTVNQSDRNLINQLLNYPDDSAGSIMTTEYVDIRETMTVAQTMAHIKETGIHKETIYTCYVTDQRRLLGIVSAKDLMTTADDILIRDLMQTEIISVTTHTDKEEVAQLFTKYDFLAIPVLDQDERMVGIVTFDDAMDVMVDEATEDIEKMAAITPSDKPYPRLSVMDLYKSRIPWLLLLMLSAVFTQLIIGKFEAALAANIILTSFIPMLMDTGGNSGSQSSVTIIRSLSLAEIRFSDIFRIMFKEMRVALLCGATLAVVNFGKLMLFDRLGVFVSLTVSLTLLATVVVAKFFGCTLPLLVKKIGLDPAVMASPIITTIVDAIALLIYFAIASAMLGI